MQFRVFFFKVKVQKLDIFGVAKISNIFLGCLKFLIFFWVNYRCWVPAYVCGNIRVPPPLGPRPVHGEFTHMPNLCTDTRVFTVYEDMSIESFPS